MIRDWLKFNSAWQPFTFKGVAAFANASLIRVFSFQIAFALLAAGSVVWFLNQAWRPVIERAIGHLPETGEIRNGQLEWPGESPALLSENRFLAFIVDLNHTGSIRVPAHVQVEFGARDVRVISLFGFYERAYATDRWIIGFNKSTLEPWWGAWRLPLLWIVFGATLCALVFTWWILACIYFLPAWLVGFFSNRQLSPGGSWKLVSAALLPAALLMVGGIFLYGLGIFGLIELLVIQAVHWLAGIVYAIGTTLSLPRLESGQKKNPFDLGSGSGPAEKPAKPENPFQEPS